MDIPGLKEEVLEKYSRLSLDDKRNEFNQELIIINTLVKILVNANEPHTPPNNYHKVVDLHQTEDEFLTNNYRELMEIKEKLNYFFNKMNK